MATVLITGGTGFIGSALARACAGDGHHVRILGQVNTPAEAQNVQRLREDGFELVEGSVTEPATVRKAAEGVDTVYHLAAAQHEAGKPDQHFHDVNVRGTRNMLEASRAAGIRRFVYGSTIGVYQAGAATVAEDSATVPDNIYGKTKLEAERIVGAFADRLQVVVIRISETYGPGDWRLLKLFRAIQKGRYFHVGRSDNLHHPVYVSDLVNGLRLAADSERACGHTIVLPGFQVLTSREMAVTIANALGVPTPRWTVPLWPLWTAATIMEWTLRPLSIQPPLHRRRMHFFTKSFRFAGDRARTLLGYEPQISFEEGIGCTAKWYSAMRLIEPIRATGTERSSV